MHNPYANMDKYPPEKLEWMSLDGLLAAQRACLFSDERAAFDEGREIQFRKDEGKARAAGKRLDLLFK